MPDWLGWIASINPLTFAIEPIRTAYASQVNLNLIALNAPYGELSCRDCISLLFILTIVSLVTIRPLLNKKLT